MILLLIFGIKQLNKLWKRHSKLFTNCHISWDTLYVHCYEDDIFRKLERIQSI